MPHTELKDQLDLINTIKKEGGYAKKWATHFAVGVPDLVCALPGVGNFLMEVKGPGSIPTPKQMYELTKFREAGGLSLLTIVTRHEEVIIFVHGEYRGGLTVRWDTQTKTYYGLKEGLIRWLKTDRLT